MCNVSVCHTPEKHTCFFCRGPVFGAKPCLQGLLPELLPWHSDVHTQSRAGLGRNTREVLGEGSLVFGKPMLNPS